MRDAGRAIADPDAEVESIHDRLTALAVDVSEDGRLPRRSWPLYGSLIASMRHTAVIVDDVASAREGCGGSRRRRGLEHSDLRARRRIACASA